MAGVTVDGAIAVGAGAIIAVGGVMAGAGHTMDMDITARAITTAGTTPITVAMAGVTGTGGTIAGATADGATVDGVTADGGMAVTAVGATIAVTVKG